MKQQTGVTKIYLHVERVSEYLLVKFRVVTDGPSYGELNYTGISMDAQYTIIEPRSPYGWDRFFFNERTELDSMDMKMKAIKKFTKNYEALVKSEGMEDRKDTLQLRVIRFAKALKANIIVYQSRPGKIGLECVIPHELILKNDTAHDWKHMFESIASGGVSPEKLLGDLVMKEAA